MNCPYCGIDSKVTNSRLQKRSNSVWRRRQCMECGAIWTTHESIKGSVAFKVRKDEDLIDFRPEVLLISLYECLRHRKTPAIDAQYVFETVVSSLNQKKTPVYDINLIATNCYTVLKRYDKLAAELYKATHPI